MLDDETKASIEAVIQECEEKLALLDPDWEDEECKKVQAQLEASRALLSDQGSPEDWQDAGDTHVTDPESGVTAERLPPALVDPATGGRYIENAFGYAEPDITRPDGADGPALTPEEVVKKDSSGSPAKPGEKKSSGRGQKNSKNTDTKQGTSETPVINQTAPDMRAELDTAEKMFLYFYDTCFANALENTDGKRIITPPNQHRDLKAVEDFAVDQGVRPIQFQLWFKEAWLKHVGGRYSLGMELDWNVLYDVYERAKNYTAPEVNEWEEIEDVLLNAYNLFDSPIKGVSEEEEKAEWGRVLKALSMYQEELRILQVQFERLMRIPAKSIQFLETMFIESPAAEEFIKKYAKKGTKYVDLPEGRLQQRKQAESLECFSEDAFNSFVGKQGEKWANQFNMERRVSWVSSDSKKAVKAQIEKWDNEGEDISNTGYRKRPEYQNLSANFGKGE